MLCTKIYFKGNNSRDIVNFYNVDIFSANFSNNDIAGYTKDNKIVINADLEGKEYNFIILKELFQNLSNNWRTNDYTVSMRNYKIKNNTDYFASYCLIEPNKIFFDIAYDEEISNASVLPLGIVKHLRWMI